MIESRKLKKLAQIAASMPSIPKDIEEYVLSVLSKKDLKEFLEYYKIELSKKRIQITSSDILSEENMNMFKKMYKDREIMFTIDKSVGAGFVVKDNDMIADFSVKKLIDNTIEKLKN